MKLSMKDLKNLTPTGVDVELKYDEGYSGDEKSIKIKVYPLTVQEKISIQELNDKFNNLNKKKGLNDEEIQILRDISQEIDSKYLYFTLKKVMDDVDEETCTYLPKSWVGIIIRGTLKAEGLNVEEIEKEKN